MDAKSDCPSAFLFDLDGTLLDTLGDLADSVNEAIALQGHSAHSEPAVRGFIGDGAESLIRRALGVVGLDQDGDEEEAVSRGLADFKEIYARRYDQRTRAYAGVPEMIAGLRERGIPLGVLSNKPHDFTVQCCHRFFGEDGENPFQVIFGQRDGVPKKPDPAGALEAAELMRVSVHQCAYVGDSPVDIETAVAAQMIPIGVSWGFRDAGELKNAGAALVVDHPDALVQLGE